MVVDRKKVEDRMDRIRRYGKDLREFGNIWREEFRWDVDLDLVYDYPQSRLDDFDSYIAQIDGYLGA